MERPQSARYGRRPKSAFAERPRSICSIAESPNILKEHRGPYTDENATLDSNRLSIETHLLRRSNSDAVDNKQNSASRARGGVGIRGETRGGEMRGRWGEPPGGLQSDSDSAIEDVEEIDLDLSLDDDTEDDDDLTSPVFETTVELRIQSKDDHKTSTAAWIDDDDEAENGYHTNDVNRTSTTTRYRHGDQANTYKQNIHHGVRRRDSNNRVSADVKSDGKRITLKHPAAGDKRRHSRRRFRSDSETMTSSKISNVDHPTSKQTHHTTVASCRLNDHVELGHGNNKSFNIPNAQGESFYSDIANKVLDKYRRRASSDDAYLINNQQTDHNDLNINRNYPNQNDKLYPRKLRPIPRRPSNDAVALDETPVPLNSPIVNQKVSRDNHASRNTVLSPISCLNPISNSTTQDSVHDIADSISSLLCPSDAEKNRVSSKFKPITD